MKDIVDFLLETTRGPGRRDNAAEECGQCLCALMAIEGILYRLGNHKGSIPRLTAPIQEEDMCMVGG